MNKREIICYETDASRLIGKAEKVVFPKTVEEIQNIVKSSENIVSRGGGTSLMGGTIPNNSIVVDMSKMNKILEFDKKKKIIYVEAGISIKELNEKLDSINFELPIQTLNQASTIGGMAAVNVFDSRSMEYGRIKDRIEEIEFINGRGELMKTGKADLSDVCGMEGITGIIAKIKLKVDLKIKRSISIFQTDNLDEIFSMSRRLKSEKEVVMLEFFSKQTSKIMGLKKKYNLVVEFDSDRGKIKGKDYKKILKLKEKTHSVLFDRGFYNVEDYKFFFDKLKEIILYLEFNEIPYLSYLGSGIVYLFFKDEEKEKRQEAIKLIKKIGGKLGGCGIGIKRKSFLDDFEKKIIHRVKLRHDPFGKLNRGKIIDFEAKIKSERHLMPLQEKEIEKVRSILQGEERTAPEVFKDIKEEGKIPEQKINKFIEEVGKQEKENLDETQELLKDYEYTYESELPKERRKKIEDFAKGVPKDAVKRKESSVDYKKIQDIMTNKYKGEDEE